MPESTHLSPTNGGVPPDNSRLIGTPQPTALEERKSPLASTITMQGTDTVRLTGVSETISQQIAKYDSSEFDDDKETVGTDAEGVWAPEIEQSFQEALAIYPPCGRRKIILSDEGKMYGRNELIARYIKLRTGKTRTRKQVSSHIQVLARRKLREIQAKLKSPNPVNTTYTEQSNKEKAIQQMQQMSSAQIVSASALHSKNLLQGSSNTGSNTSASQTSSVTYGGSQFWQPAITQAEDVPGISRDTTMADKLMYTPNGYAQNHSFYRYIKPFSSSSVQTNNYPPGINLTVPKVGAVSPQGGSPTAPPWLGRSIATRKLRMIEHSAFVEEEREGGDTYQKHLFVHIGERSEYSDPSLEPVDIRQIYDKFPEKSGGLKEMYEKGPQDAFFLVKFWADLNTNIADAASTFYGVTTTYESTENMVIQCSTKVCSFGKQVVEKVETEYASFEGGRYLYKIHRSPMCEYMINFIHKLKHLPEKYMMNSVLENFTILQVISNRESGETLLCVAYVFEVSTSEHGAQHHIYKLVKD